MNEMNDWFPEGEDSYGNSSCSSNFSKTELTKINEDYDKNFENNYQKWLADHKNGKISFSLVFFKEAFNRKEL